MQLSLLDEAKPANPDHERFKLLRKQILEALAIHEDAGLPANQAIAEMIKFLSAISLQANGPVTTIAGIGAMLDQLRAVLPASAAVADADKNFPPPAGNA